jgi:ectoine hydroxylase-related dioxygenase (phytanoyl-CoA dioxygenase family)
MSCWRACCLVPSWMRSVVRSMMCLRRNGKPHSIPTVGRATQTMKRSKRSWRKTTPSARPSSHASCGVSVTRDRSQRIWNLLAKADRSADLIEHPAVLGLARATLGEDCILSDCSATSVGAHTDGGSWHVDVPLGQLPEPLPDFPLTTQNVWMLDDFTERNGATRVVPGSHRTRRKPNGLRIRRTRRMRSH